MLHRVCPKSFKSLAGDRRSNGNLLLTIQNSDGKEDARNIFENRENVLKVKRLLQQCALGVKDNYFC